VAELCGCVCLNGESRHGHPWRLQADGGAPTTAAQKIALCRPLLHKSVKGMHQKVQKIEGNR
jgi:hypothetical protein